MQSGHERRVSAHQIQSDVGLAQGGQSSIPYSDNRKASREGQRAPLENVHRLRRLGLPYEGWNGLYVVEPI